MAGTNISFDDFIANLPKTPVRAKKKTVPGAKETISSSAEIERGNQQSDAAFLDASDAASNLLQVIAQYKKGAISKAKAEEVYNLYKNKTSILRTISPDRADNVENSILGKPTTPTKPTPTVPSTTPKTTSFTTPLTVSGQTQKGKPKKVVTSADTKTTDGKPIGTTTTDNKPPADTKPPKSPEQFMAEYGVQLALINSDPSLKALFATATKNKWNADRFKAEILNTSWAKNHSAEWQTNQRTMLESPATYAASYNRMREKIAMLAVKDGIAITPEQIGAEATQNADGTWNIKTGTDNSVARWALDQYGAGGLSDDLITKHLAELGKINLAMPGGVAGDSITKLKAYAGQMGMGYLSLPPTGTNAVGEDYFSSAAKSILLGKSTYETWQADVLAKSKDIFKAFAPAIDAGQTVQSIAAPYMNTLANMLEVPISQIDIGSSTGYGKMVRDALMGTDPANQKPMALYDFEKQLKARPEWGKTNNARDTVMGGVNDLLKSFGKVSG